MNNNDSGVIFRYAKNHLFFNYTQDIAIEVGNTIGYYIARKVKESTVTWDDDLLKWILDVPLKSPKMREITACAAGLVLFGAVVYAVNSTTSYFQKEEQATPDFN